MSKIYLRTDKIVERSNRHTQYYCGFHFERRKKKEKRITFLLKRCLNLHIEASHGALLCLPFLFLTLIAFFTTGNLQLSVSNFANS